MKVVSLIKLKIIMVESKRDGVSTITDHEAHWDSGLNNGAHAGNTAGYPTFVDDEVSADSTTVDNGIVSGETRVFTLGAVNAIDAAAIANDGLRRIGLVKSKPNAILL